MDAYVAGLEKRERGVTSSSALLVWPLGFHRPLYLIHTCSVMGFQQNLLLYWFSKLAFTPGLFAVIARSNLVKISSLKQPWLLVYLNITQVELHHRVS